MPKERQFLDIRCYESNHQNVAGTSLPSGPGRIFALPKSIDAIGARIARKLREYGFVAGVYDHLYVNFTTLLPEGQCRYSLREVEERIKYIDFGLVPEKVNRLSDAEKEMLVCRSIFNILRFVASGHRARLAIVDRVATDVEERGSELEIVHKTKETAVYAVTVTYRIRPNGKQSVGLIEYHDKGSGQKLKSEFARLKHYEDVFALVGSISVARGVITLKPKASFKASLDTKSYKVPIRIVIAELNAG